MSKALSNGTLSLRFMQNAQRAKYEAEVEAEQAKVKDEAEWEIPHEVKEQWGIASSSSSSQSQSYGLVTHESSYVPFTLVPGLGDDSKLLSQAGPSQLKGRRKFSKYGEEVAASISSAEPQIVNPLEQSSSDQRLSSISGFQAPLPVRTPPKHKGGKDNSASRRTKTVQMLIREDNGRGLRDPAPLAQITSGPESTSSPATATKAAAVGFLRPAGIDHSAAQVKQKRKSAGAGDSAKVKRVREYDIPEATSSKDGTSKRKRVVKEDV